MKYFPTTLLIFSIVFFANAQTYEIGGMIGGANYIGDVGNTTFINPSSLAVGGLVRWNRSPRHSFRASLLLAKIEADDGKSSENRRSQRGYKFKNTIKEFSVGMEYTFWEFDVHSNRSISTPYLYTGLTAFTYHALYKKNNDRIASYGEAISFAIPMVVGYKATLTPNVMVGFEIGARYTFTDNLDGSNPKKENTDNESLKFGNTNNDDWYVFSGITVTFAFGRKPCYCNF